VIIGKSGRVKQQIEKMFGVAIEVDSDTGNAIISTSAPADQMEAFRALEVITAISRGFSPERAYHLCDDDEMLFQQIDLHQYTGRSQNGLERIKGRIIGEGGKARKTIEELSGAYVSVYGHTVAFIGKYRAVRLATDAITMLAKGSMHKSVYTMLQAARRRDRLDRMRLWKDKNEDDEGNNEDDEIDAKPSES
jgi:ribosomal RNA assembly protein